MHETNTQANTTTGRNAKGQFTRGNAGGPGNPFARQVAELRRTMLEAVTPEILRNVVQALIAQAMLGKVDAIKLLFQYVLGKPVEMRDPDRVDADEWKLTQESAIPMSEVHALFNSTAPELAITMVEAVQEAHVRDMQKQMQDEEAEQARRAATGYDEDDDIPDLPPTSEPVPLPELEPSRSRETAERVGSMDDFRGRFVVDEESRERERDVDRHPARRDRRHERNGHVDERPSRRSSRPMRGDQRRAVSKR